MLFGSKNQWHHALPLLKLSLRKNCLVPLKKNRRDGWSRSPSNAMYLQFIKAHLAISCEQRDQELWRIERNDKVYPARLKLCKDEGCKVCT